MSDDIYDQLDKKKTNKKVPPRSEDGFDSAVGIEIPAKLEQERIQEESDDSDLVITAKPKSIALEVNVRNQLDKYLFDHKEVSWDTFIEAAVHYALTSKAHDSIVEDAASRLTQRKLSSTKRRIKTMTANVYNSK